VTKDIREEGSVFPAPLFLNLELVRNENYWKMKLNNIKQITNLQN
jgi:hypothetical protein